MKKLRKRYQTNEGTLAAYYTCVCNHLACACTDPHGGGDNMSVTNVTYYQLLRQEDYSWNE